MADVVDGLRTPGRQRDGVVPPLGKGVASGNPPQAHPATAEPAVPLDRLVSVLRAGWVVAARSTEHVGERGLIQADQPHENGRHRNRRRLRAPRISESSAGKARSSAGGRAITTTSKGMPEPDAGQPSFSKPRRATSRTRRRARLRDTDPRTFLLTATPTRPRSPLAAAAKTTSPSPTNTRRERTTRWKSEPRTSRDRFFTSTGRRRCLSGREPAAAFAPSVPDHAPSARRGHATKKTVHASAVPLLGLIGSLDLYKTPRGTGSPPMRTALRRPSRIAEYIPSRPPLPSLLSHELPTQLYCGVQAPLLTLAVERMTGGRVIRVRTRVFSSAGPVHLIVTLGCLW